MQARVAQARTRQLQRSGTPNAHLDPGQTLHHCVLTAPDQAMLAQAMERRQLSARSMHRILRVARSIADLAGGGPIERTHLAEAIGYRQLDRACPDGSP